MSAATATVVTAEMIAAARAEGISSYAFSDRLGITYSSLYRRIKMLGITWGKRKPGKTPAERDRDNCKAGHPRAKWQKVVGTRMRCTKCIAIQNTRRAKENRDASKLAHANADGWSWTDYMAAAIREDNQNLPAWAPRKSDQIKAWLVAHKVKPA